MGLAWAQSSGPASSAAYPKKPVKILVGFTPGGVPDISARLIGQKLTEAWGQPVIVENRLGAGGNIAAQALANAAPDGYTLLMGSIGSHSIAVSYYKDPGYNFKKDLTAISMAGTLSNIVVISNELPVKTLAELVALAKKEPGKLTCGSSGSGGLIHLTCEMFKVAAGIDVLHIPYKGTSLLMPDLISGRVTMALDTLPPYLPMLKDGKVRALAITTAKRSALMPDLPTIAESGYPGFESVASYGFFAPTGTAPAIIERLNREINSVLVDPELKAKLVQQAIEIEGSTPQALTTFVDGEIAKWATVIKASNIQRE
jgi:tripartite-type tricarboxylate transporter receptor subunit TctC